MNHQPFGKLFQHQFYVLHSKVTPIGSCAACGNFLIWIEVGRYEDDNKIFLICKSVPCYFKLMTNSSKQSHKVFS